MARVTFADIDTEPKEGRDTLIDETRPLLSQQQWNGVRADEDLKVPVSRLHRKSKQGTLIGKGLRRSSHSGVLPLHRGKTTSTATYKIILVFIGSTALIALIVLVTILLHPPTRLSGPYPNPPIGFPENSKEVNRTGRNPAFLIKAKNGAVASENILCSEIGVDVMKQGGNAVDAAIATTFCIGVVNMFSSGIGGGGFMTIRIPPSHPNETSNVWTIDFRETAPAASNATMYVDDPMTAIFGGLSVGVPGEVKGLEEAYRRWGSLPWSTLVQPSVDLAAGWKVGVELGRRIELFKPLMLQPVWKDIFAPNGELLREGELIRRTALSQTLAAIAKGGADAFYKGPIADAIVEKVRSTGGIMTHEDLASYAVEVRPALQGTYMGRKIYTTHAPTSGPVLLHMFNLLERYDLMGEGRTGLNVHRVVEAIKFGFAARTRVSDPKFREDIKTIDVIPTKAYADYIAKNITDDSTHPPEYYNPVFDVEIDHGTSHTSVVDKNGMAVAITSTVNLIFGSQVMDEVTGIILNDEMDDFSTPGTPNAFGLYPSPYNYPAPNKRPLSSTVPTIVEHPDGSFYVAIGGSGGSRIFPAVFQVLLGIDRWGLDVGSAVEFGRVHDQLYPLLVDVDNVYPQEGIEGLRERGHNVTVSDVNRIAAVIQAVVKEGDTIYAASDSRKNGIAAGY